MNFNEEGLGFRVCLLGFRVWGLGLDLGLNHLKGLGFRADRGIRVEGDLGFQRLAVRERFGGKALVCVRFWRSIRGI